MVYMYVYIWCSIEYMVYSIWLYLEVQGSYNQAASAVINHLQVP